LDGGEVAAHDLLQPSTIPRQERPGYVEVVGDDTLVMATAAWFMRDPRRRQAARSLPSVCAVSNSGFLPSIKSAALIALAAATAAATSITAR
jgi:hypothetical protein